MDSVDSKKNVFGPMEEGHNDHVTIPLKYPQLDNKYGKEEDDNPDSSCEIFFKLPPIKTRTQCVPRTDPSDTNKKTFIKIPFDQNDPEAIKLREYMQKIDLMISGFTNNVHSHVSGDINDASDGDSNDDSDIEDFSGIYD